MNGAGDQLFPEPADFDAPGHEIGIKQSQQSHQPQHQGPGHGDFKVNVALLEKGRREEYGQKPGADQQAGQGHDQP